MEDERSPSTIIVCIYIRSSILLPDVPADGASETETLRNSCPYLLN